MKTLLKRLLHPLVFFLAIVLVFEEWLWDGLKAQLHRLSRLPLVAACEQALRRLPPPVALFVMALPGLALLPFKLLALHLLAQGHALLGLATLLAAKLTGTALAAYLFDLVRDSARKMGWFNRLYLQVIGLLASAKTWLRAQPSYVWVRETVTHLRASLRRTAHRRGAWARKWAAAVFLARRAKKTSSHESQA